MSLNPAEPGPNRAPARATVGSQCLSAPAEYCSCQEVCAADSCPNPAVCANANSDGCPYEIASDNDAGRNFGFDKSSPPSRTRVAPNSFEWTKFEDICCYDQQLVPNEKNAPATGSARRRCSNTCPNIGTKQAQDPDDHSEQQQENIEDTNIVNKANVDNIDRLRASHPVQVKPANARCCASGSVTRGGPHAHRGSMTLKTLISQDHMVEKPSLITVDRKPHDKVEQSAPPCRTFGRLGKAESLEVDGSSARAQAESGAPSPARARAPCLCRMPPAFRTVCTGNLSGTCPCAKCNQ